MKSEFHLGTYEQHREKLFGIAYRMLGTLSDAEDVLQEAYLRWSRTNPEQIDSPVAYLTSTVSRLCIDRLRQLKRERERYRGPWLPEPVLTDDEAFDLQSTFESLSTAFMLMLEQLSPMERAVFILREAFELPHDDIAKVLDIQSANARQLARRARLRLGDQAQEMTTSRHDEKAKHLMTRFIDAAEQDDLDALKSMLADDVIAYSDGGGRVSAAIIPLQGIQRVVNVFLHIFKKLERPVEFVWLPVNCDEGIAIYEAGKLNSVTTFEIEDNRLRRLYIMRNPDKLSSFVVVSPDPGKTVRSVLH